MFQVYSFESTRQTSSWAMALAWAPLLYQLQGTQRLAFDVKVVKLAEPGEQASATTIASFGRKGWDFAGELKVAA